MIKRSFDWLDEVYSEKKNLLDSKVSVVNGVCNSSWSRLMRLRDIVNVMCDLPEVQKLKEMKGWKHCGNEEKEKAFKEQKMKVPAYTLITYGEDGAGTSTMNVIKNPYMIVDIDNVEISNEMMEKLNSFEFVLGTGISASGEGYYSIIKFDNSKVNSKETFYNMYKELEEYYKDYDIEIDSQCGNINRLRVFSPYKIEWNKNYEYAFSPSLKKEVKVNRVNNDDYTPILEGKLFTEPYVKGEMHWKRYGWANTIYNMFGEDGYDLYNSILCDDPDKRDLEAVWRTATRGDKESSSYCINKLEKAGYLQTKPKIIEVENDKKGKFNSGKFSWGL